MLVAGMLVPSGYLGDRASKSQEYRTKLYTCLHRRLATSLVNRRKVVNICLHLLFGLQRSLLSKYAICLHPLVSFQRLATSLVTRAGHRWFADKSHMCLLTSAQHITGDPRRSLVIRFQILFYLHPLVGLQLLATSLATRAGHWWFAAKLDISLHLHSNANGFLRHGIIDA